MRLRLGLGRGFWLALAVVVALLGAQALTGGNAGGVGAVRTVLLEALAPFADAVSVVGGAVRGADASVARLVQLQTQNRRLQSEVTTLDQQQTGLEELRLENARLRALLGLKASLASLLPYPAGAVAARVIARTPTTWFASLLLDKGRADGVSAGMIAMAPKGLVGRVSAVTLHTATVRLITNPDTAVGGMVERASSRDAGVAFGILGEDLLTMKFFQAKPNVKVGDVIITSGLGGVYPKGLPVGRIASVAPERYGQVRTAVVGPAVNLGNLEEVLLIRAPAGR